MAFCLLDENAAAAALYAVLCHNQKDGCLIMGSEKHEQALRNYEQLFEQLSPLSLENFDDFFADDAVFRDPFNDVKGVAAIKNVFQHMYQVCEAPRFTVLSSVLSGDTAWLHWDFSFTHRQRSMQIIGASMVKFADDGRVSMHIDYWDAASQLYEKLPVIGWLMAKLRSKFAVPGL